MEIGCSIIVCCYNSSLRLPPTITSLANQNYEGAIEVVFVDNNSKDNTLEVIADNKFQFNKERTTVKVVSEFKQGLAFARLKGVQEASFDTIIFCDDDNWLEADYVSEALKLISSNSTAGAIGGCSTAVSDTEFPSWFEEKKGAYAVGEQSTANGRINERGFVWGAGLVTKKSLFLECYQERFKSILKDRSGKELSSGGDTEYCFRLQMLGYDIYYSNKLIFKHFISRERLSEHYINGLIKSFDDCVIELNKYRLMIYLMGLPWSRKIILFISSIIYIMLAKLGLSKQDEELQRRKIFFMSGIQLGRIDDASKIIRNIYSHKN